jgi:hypothetical protein
MADSIRVLISNKISVTARNISLLGHARVGHKKNVCSRLQWVLDKNAMVSEQVEVLMANKVLIAKGPSLPRKAPVDEMYN